MATTFLSAQDIPDRPSPARLVNDLAGILKSDELNALEQNLVEFNNQTSTQIAVVIVPSLNGYDKSDFAFRLGEKWGVGAKGKNNGLVILVKPKTATERGEAFIATGYGVEEFVPDALAYQIVDNEMIPYFKKGDYFGGIAAASQVLQGLTQKAFTADEYTKKSEKKGSGIAGIIAIIFIVIIIKSIFGSRNNHTTLGGAASAALPWILLGGLGRGGSSGGFGGFSSGGGGFGGFGGGSFGGGGAGGSW